MLAPIELIAVKIKQGEVTQREWVEALADRVSRMALELDDPDEAAVWASRVLDLPEAGNPRYLGQALVTDNWNLLEHFNLAVIDGSPFPATVSESSEDAEYALEHSDFALWVELARSMVSPTSSD
jgi:hypothetical protein